MMTSRARRMARRLVSPRYRPQRYWEHRAPELIRTYEDPGTWAGRGWNIAQSPEAEIVPKLLGDLRANSVVVAGAGTGRQYEYLENTGLTDLRGFDLSPTMVAECRRRFPSIDTVVGDVIHCADQHAQADVVLAVTVLQHVRPQDISRALAELKTLAHLALVVVEFSRFHEPSSYTFEHPYRELMADWPLQLEVAFDASATRLTELLAWTRPSAGRI